MSVSVYRDRIHRPFTAFRKYMLDQKLLTHVQTVIQPIMIEAGLFSCCLFVLDSRSGYISWLTCGERDQALHGSDLAFTRPGAGSLGEQIRLCEAGAAVIDVEPVKQLIADALMRPIGLWDLVARWCWTRRFNRQPENPRKRRTPSWICCWFVHACLCYSVFEDMLGIVDPEF